MELTAKELHDLYDPLFALVLPDAWLNDIAFVGGKWWLKVSGFDNSFPISVAIAAALCRVAVEDWLRNFQTSSTQDGEPNSDLMPKLSDDHENTYVFLTWPRRWDTVEVDVEDDSAMFSGPTIHHALVACALAVAKVSEPLSASRLGPEVKT